MCFCNFLKVNFILTTKKNILPYPFKTTLLADKNHAHGSGNYLWNISFAISICYALRSEASDIIILNSQPFFACETVYPSTG